MAVHAIPTSTYRLQLSASFTLDDARSVLGYLQSLGVDWVYLSPVLTAVPGSTHGYNVVDHSHVDPERGGDAAFERFCASAHAFDMGVLLDIVPNHVGVERPECNPWWWSVLRDGQESPFAHYFDIDWEFGDGRLRIPVLGEPAVEAIATGSLRIVDDQLRYYDHVYPLAPGSADDGADVGTVLSRQHYELMHWSRADHELNYRRFFAVNELAAIRVEDPEVFEASHTLVLRWLHDGLIDGLRVDHPDGLRDPTAYLTQLSSAMNGKYLVVEKILEGDEQLPPFWATHGTTGYDALGVFDRVFVQADAETELRDLDTDASTGPLTWTDLIHGTKRMVADGILGSEVARLVRDYRAESGADDPTGDAELTDAMAELLTCFPVYRSYLPYGHEHLKRAVDDAQARHPELRNAIGRLAQALSDPSLAVAIRFQQTSGMVMAKGVEDTAFYRTGALASLTEVGADPSQFAVPTDSYHRAQQVRLASTPHSMTALSTHDTKRGEDTRARINAISLLPTIWKNFLQRQHAKHPLGDLPFENLLWQSIVGSWPRERQALHGYAEKAAREAGTQTSWHAPDLEFETRMHTLIDALFDDPEVANDVTTTVGQFAEAGWANGLAAKVLQITAPGVSDVYQGSEFWEDSLVDPDNRRPVDFGERARVLAALNAGALPPVDASGAAKLYVTSRALRLRRNHQELFTEYRPLPLIDARTADVTPRPDYLAQGLTQTRDEAGSVECAIAVDRGGAVVVASTRNAGGYRGEVGVLLAAGRYRDVFTARIVQAIDQQPVQLTIILDTYPVALLVKESA